MMERERNEVQELLDKLKEFNCSSFEELDENLNPSSKPNSAPKSKPAFEPKHNYKRSLTFADVRAIRRRHYNGESRDDLSKYYEVSFSVINDIIHRKLWANAW